MSNPIKMGLLAFVMVTATFLGGCAVAEKVGDVITGVGTDGAGVVGPLLQAAGNLPGWLGWAFGLLGGVAAGYKTARNKKLGLENDNYKEASEALVVGFQRVMEGKLKEKVSLDEVKAILEQAKVELMTNPAFLTELVALIKAKQQ